ncbi:hypothetical protein [Phyllobacterium pellucidum]|nr:hypothetical protein [Phyllobacterium sp. T1018]UGY11078.1 hypothetical protein LLE51_007935 [Phyllobacterium sp. T1018]
MKITMELTVADLIRTLRWQAIALSEKEIAAPKPETPVRVSGHPKPEPKR